LGSKLQEGYSAALTGIFQKNNMHHPGGAFFISMVEVAVSSYLFL